MDRNELYKIIFLSMFAYFLYELIEIRSYLNYMTLELSNIFLTLNDINTNLGDIHNALKKDLAFYLSSIEDALESLALIESNLDFIFRFILKIP